MSLSHFFPLSFSTSSYVDLSLYSSSSRPQSGSRAEDLVGGAAVLLDVLVPAVLVGKTPKEGPAAHAASDVSNTVFAFGGIV